LRSLAFTVYKNVDEMNNQLLVKHLPAAAIVMSLAACNSSSDSASPLMSQAVDGYIVAADVSCDEVSSGKTGAAGMFSCSAGTNLSRVSGGFDVGLDEVATTGTVPFTGVMRAPAGEPYVTPMTTLSVALAFDGQPEDAAFSLDNYQAAKTTLADTLGISLSAISENPVESLEAARGSAKIHHVLAAFAPNVDSYEEATAAFATVIIEEAARGGVLGLTANVASTMAAINTKLNESKSTLAMATADLNQASANVAIANQAVQEATSPAKVGEESQKALIDQAPVTIDRNDAIVTLSSRGQNAVELDIAGFESTSLNNGQYTAQLFSGLTSVAYENSVFQFNQNIIDAKVTVAFEVRSVNANDPRALSFYSDDIMVTANKGRSASLVVAMASENSTFKLRSTDSAGVLTEVVVATDGETFRSDGSELTIDLDRINKQLSSMEIEDILSESGDFSVTLVIQGLRVNERTNNATTEAKQFTINTGAGAIKGNGFRGYVSFIR